MAGSLACAGSRGGGGHGDLVSALRERGPPAPSRLCSPSQRASFSVMTRAPAITASVLAIHYYGYLEAHKNGSFLDASAAREINQGRRVSADTG